MRIAFDLDDCLVDLDSEVEKIFIKYNMKKFAPINWYLSNYPEPIRSETFELFSDPKRMCNLKPFPKAVEVIDKLKKLGHNVIVITARDLEYKEQTIEYVQNLFNVKCFVTEPNKSKLDILLSEKIETFIDDSPVHILEYQKAGINMIMVCNENSLYNHHMKEHVITIENMNELYDLII